MAQVKPEADRGWTNCSNPHWTRAPGAGSSGPTEAVDRVQEDRIACATNRIADERHRSPFAW